MAPEATLSIGEFSRSTLLSARQLRDYHEAGLLLPDSVDPWSGYRAYRVDQIEDAVLIRRLRELGVPLTRIRIVMGEAGPSARLALVTQELDTVGRDLSRRRAVLDTVRQATGTAGPGVVSVREFAPVTAMVRSGRAGYASIEGWCDDAFGALYGHLAALGTAPAGPGCANYTEEFYAEDSGEVRAWVPVAHELAAGEDITFTTIPGGRYAVFIHHGDFADFDLSYGVLGRWVATHAESLTGAAVREQYLIGPADSTSHEDWRTEICWPITTEGIAP